MGTLLYLNVVLPDAGVGVVVLLDACIREFYDEIKGGADDDHCNGHPPLTLLEFAAEEVGVDLGVIEALGVKLGGVGGEGGGVEAGIGSVVVLCF